MCRTSLYPIRYPIRWSILMLSAITVHWYMYSNSTISSRMAASLINSSKSHCISKPKPPGWRVILIRYRHRISGIQVCRNWWGLICRWGISIMRSIRWGMSGKGWIVIRLMCRRLITLLKWLLAIPRNTRNRNYRLNHNHSSKSNNGILKTTLLHSKIKSTPTMINALMMGNKQNHHGKEWFSNQNRKLMKLDLFICWLFTASDWIIFCLNSL